ncbi:MAG TPA: hypothetical protein VGB24_22045 [Longimicrobium sp.]|jgi:hypothetical protein|uniref:hypothetical protein n=1 Tax=Longimicrobium sp. TaxID=2029185 RepID=UPI002EDB832D
MNRLIRAAATVLVLLLAACDSGRDLQVRTYELHRLSKDEALTLVTPYVDDGGYLSGSNELITVRTSPARQAEIAKVLAKFDAAPVEVVLHFRVVEANGFATRDSALADVEPLLRGLFRYDGYRLAREATVQVTEGGKFSQGVGGPTALEGEVERVTRVGNEYRVKVSISLTAPGGAMQSSVTAVAGKTVVVGSQKEGSAAGAWIVVMRPEVR